MLDRFALLAHIPALTSTQEKARALAHAAHTGLNCERVTALLFAEASTTYATFPSGPGFALRDEGPAMRSLFFAELEPFDVGGAFYIESCDCLQAVNPYASDSSLFIVPLKADERAAGALVYELAAAPQDAVVREVRTFADIAAWMLTHARAASVVDRETKQSALLEIINERARKSLDRQSMLQSVAHDVCESFNAMRCVIFERETPERDYARVAASAKAQGAQAPLQGRMRISETWLKDALAGAVVARENVTEENARDAFLRAAGAESALMVPLVIEGRVEHAIALHFGRPQAFDEIDTVMLRSVGSHVGLALANEQLYDLERLRRARAESLERVVRMLRDTQTIEEVLLVFAVTVSHEVKLTCAAYEIDGPWAVRRAVRAVQSAREVAPERIDAAQLLPLLERDDISQSSALAPSLRESIFHDSEGLIASLRIDGNLWGLVLFAAPRGAYDWADHERRVYFHTVVSHLELALSGALGFERIQQLARALAESNEFKDDLLAMLAHDFKGPLTVILGYCELLLESTSGEVHEELETIHSQTQRLVRLSEDAVALAQTQAGGFSLDRSTLDLRGVITESVKAHNRGDPRIHVSMVDDPVPVSLDMARFNHVLDNLLMNALKYSKGEVDVRLSRGGNNATIVITDHGIGIPASELGAVFARFGRGSNARRKGISGSGVGLYVSRKIVEVHGGSIAVQSKEGEGSTFTVTLPLSSP